MSKNETEIEYSFNWLSLLIKVVIFAILLILFIWIVSKFAKKTCDTKEEDYYVVNTFTDSQYNSKGDNDFYEYRYTIKLLNINPDNSKDVSIKIYNYFHNDDEYKDYLALENSNLDIINQTNNKISVDTVENFKKSSLTAKEFTFEVSDIYIFKGEYHIDITLKIKDHADIEAYSDNYFVPIHLKIQYTETSNCKAK